MSTNRSILTWLEVRDFLNKCSDEQLNAKAKVSSDDSEIEIMGIDLAEEDYYIDPECPEEGIYKKSELSVDELEFHEIDIYKGDIVCGGIDVGY